MVRKVISGGQIGADIAALRAAKRCGIKTGGMMPKGFLTLSGPKPEYEIMYSLHEHESSKLYPPRTYWNVKNSDATLRIAENFGTRGERCTLKAIKKFKKPYIDIHIRLDDWWPERMVAFPPPHELAEWIVRHEVKVLNVSGNALKHLEEFIKDYLEEVFVREEVK
jgi:hypothetical protein